MPEQDWVAWATLGRPHGLRGELRLHLSYPDSPHLEAIDQVRLQFEGRTLDTRIAHVRPGTKAPLIALQGLRFRDEAAAWTGATVLVPATVFDELGDDEFYGYQLEGLTLVDATGTELGTVLEVADFGAGDLLDVRFTDGRNEYVPFMAPWVLDVDVDAGTVRVDLTDLFD